jgi:Zn-dependent peptidase ImmA (M78 family)
MGLRWGFKSEANDYAREFRSELGLQPHESLSPWILATHLDIPILPLSNLADGASAAVATLTGPERSSFSALTLFEGTRRAILHNDAHHPRRQASNIAHEISHAVLGHTPGPTLDQRSIGVFDKTQEEEAQWLGPALLISEEAALFIVQEGIAMDQAIEIYGVSQDLIEFRIRKTGADRKVKRGYRYRRRAV